MNAGALIALLLILFTVAGGILLGGTDVSSPTLAMKEISQGAPGSATATIVFNQVVGVLLGILVTGLVAGIGSLVFSWARNWLESRKKGDWEPGPNANFRRRGQPRQPEMMSRDEIFQLALLNAMTQGQAQKYMPQISQTLPEDTTLNDF